MEMEVVEKRERFENHVVLFDSEIVTPHEKTSKYSVTCRYSLRARKSEARSRDSMSIRRLFLERILCIV